MGTEKISRAIELAGPNKINSVSALLGAANAAVFRDSVSSGSSLEQAVWHTPLGKSVSSLGFQVVEVNGEAVMFLYR